MGDMIAVPGYLHTSQREHVGKNTPEPHILFHDGGVAAHEERRGVFVQKQRVRLAHHLGGRVDLCQIPLMWRDDQSGIPSSHRKSENGGRRVVCCLVASSSRVDQEILDVDLHVRQRIEHGPAVDGAHQNSAGTLALMEFPGEQETLPPALRELAHASWEVSGGTQGGQQGHFLEIRPDAVRIQLGIDEQVHGDGQDLAHRDPRQRRAILCPEIDLTPPVWYDVYVHALGKPLFRDVVAASQDRGQHDGLVIV